MNYFLFFIITFTLLLFLFPKLKKKALIILLIILLLLILIYPNNSLNSAKDGVNLWLFVVVPSLLPFFIINDILISLNFPENISKLFAPLAKILFNTSGYGAYVFVMSIFCGYPSGARITNQLILENKITNKEAEQILTFSSTSGPLFIIGAVGIGMLGNSSYGYLLYFSHIIGAILNGVIINTLFYRKYKFNNEKISIKSIHKTKNSSDILSKSILSSLVICGIIGGYIILFSVIIELLENLGYFLILQKILNSFLSFSTDISYVISNLIKSSIEISNGCKIISSIKTCNEIKLYILSFIIAFSGLSIIGQVSSIISETSINLKKYVLSKINHGILSTIVCYMLIKFNIFESLSYVISLSYSLKNINELVIIEVLLILLLLFNILYLIKKFYISKHVR